MATPNVDLLWESMNIATRVGKAIESTNNLIPKNTNTNISPVADLQELLTTINSVRTTFVPFVTNAKKKQGSDQFFDLCVKGVRDTLSDLVNYFKDLEKDFSIYVWKTQKVKIYQMDFTLKLKLDQFSALFSEDPKEKKKNSGSALFSDPDGAILWTKLFGENTIMVPWPQFLQQTEQFLQLPLKQDEDSIKHVLDFCNDDYVSSFEFSVFLKWFSPLRGSFARMLEAIKGGLLCGFIPAVEASLLLEGKKEGTYLIRFSKTQPGSYAVSFVDNVGKIKHCLLYSVNPSGLTLKNPPTVYTSLKDFADHHTSKLKHPLGNRWTLKNKLPLDVKDANSHPSPSPEHHDDQKGKGTGLDSNNTCVVCMDAPFETVFLECGHLACCQSCSEKLKLCPICRNPITRIIPIFRAS